MEISLSLEVETIVNDGIIKFTWFDYGHAKNQQTFVEVK